MGLTLMAIDLEEKKIRILPYTVYKNKKWKLKVRHEKFCKKITTCTILGTAYTIVILTMIRDSEAAREKTKIWLFKKSNILLFKGY